MKRTALSLGAAVICLASAQAASLSLRHGPLDLTFDEATGALLRIACGGAVLAEAGPERSPTSFGFGPKSAQTWLEQLQPPRQLLKRHQPSPDTLELTVRVGDYELVERYKLHADQPRLDRSATLINRGKETVKLRAFTFRTPGVKATLDGFYRFPCQWPPTSRPFAQMEPGRSHSGGLSTAPLVAQLTPSRSLIWASCTDDSPHVRVEEGKGQFDVVQGVEAAGYLRPNQPQEIGFVSMFVVDAGYWDALPKLWDWLDSVGIKVPADRPEWLKGAVLYSFHPGGTIGSNFTDLGGFKAATEYLLPTLPKLGVTAIWIMPVEWKGPYWPLDYYRLQDGLGTAEELKALVKRAHELGLKVLMDIVPHGGAPQAVHNQAHPEFMLRREDGSHLDYWLNDFARPDWQDFIAKVAEHFLREYDADGFRIDACYGSHELNWDPAVPYARASLSGLSGGLQMTKRIRDVVRKLKPKDGAVLAEVESVRHAAVSDFQYDFNLCYNVLHAWRKMPAAEFVPLLQDYLEEQKYVYPRGTLFLRHIESHDSLRAQGWYGVAGMRAMYVLSALIDGVPLIYQGMERGHEFALGCINALRKYRIELAQGEAFYRAVKLQAPGVFNCVRRFGDRQTFAAMNLGRGYVDAGHVPWVDEDQEQPVLSMYPLAFQYSTRPHFRATLPLPADLLLAGIPVLAEDLVPQRNYEREGEPTKWSPPPGPKDSLTFDGAAEWFVDTIEGRLYGRVGTCPPDARPKANSSIYWRPQRTNVLWESELAPLDQGSPTVGVVGRDGGTREATYREEAERPLRNMRLLQSPPDRGRLLLEGTEGYSPELYSLDRLWFRPLIGLVYGDGLRITCIASDHVVSNKHFTCVLRRQGGVIRELFVGDKVVAKDHDLYGDQEYFHAGDSSRIAAGNDVESGIRIWKADDGLHLAFEGQLRGFGRFDLKRPPLWYRNEYVFTDATRFRQKWAFRTEKSFKDRTAFLASIVQLPDADRFRFLRSSLPKVSDLREVTVVSEGLVGEGGQRRGEMKGKPTPDRIEFLAGGKTQFSLRDIKTPPGCDPNVFVHGRQLFVTLLDGKNAVMQEGTWYEFELDWDVSGR